MVALFQIMISDVLHIIVTIVFFLNIFPILCPLDNIRGSWTLKCYVEYVLTVPRILFFGNWLYVCPLLFLLGSWSGLQYW